MDACHARHARHARPRSPITTHRSRPTDRTRARATARSKISRDPPRTRDHDPRTYPSHPRPPTRSVGSVGSVGRSPSAPRAEMRARGSAAVPRAQRECATPGRGPRTANSPRERDERDAFVSARERARDSRASRLPAIDRSIIRGGAFRDTRRGSLVRSSSGGELNGASRDEGDSARWRAWKK